MDSDRGALLLAVLIIAVMVITLACDKGESIFDNGQAPAEAEYEEAPTIVTPQNPLCNCQCNQGNTAVDVQPTQP